MNSNPKSITLLLLCILNGSVEAQNNTVIESKRLPAVQGLQSSTLWALPVHQEIFGYFHSANSSIKSSVVNLLSAKQQQLPRTNAPVTQINFAGISSINNLTNYNKTFTPSDANGDVGPIHYVQTVNSLFQVFDKLTGNPLGDPFELSNVFASAGQVGPCATENQGEPIALYDPLANRWILSQLNFDTDSGGIAQPPFHQCIAISTSEDPTGSYFSYDFIIPNKNLGDYPKLGVWQDGYYMTFSQINGNYLNGIGVMVFDRNQMLLGNAAGANYHNLVNQSTLSQLLPSDIDGTDLPSITTPNYLIGFDSNALTHLPINKLRVFAAKADFSTPTSTGFIKEIARLPVASFNASVCNDPSQISFCISQPRDLMNSQQKLDSLSDRPMYRLQYRYFPKNCPVDNSLAACATLVLNHTVRGRAINEAAVRWYLLTQDITNNKIKVAQQGTYSPDNYSRWMGSVALNKRGDLAIGYSITNKFLFPSIGYAGRLVGDAPNMLTLEGMLYIGGGSQSNSERWGDYSSLAVDPVDECTFWYTNQYYLNNQDGANALWQTRIGSFKLSKDC